MLKFIPQFSCWKVGPGETFVIASCAKTHEVRLYVIYGSARVETLSPDVPMPDIRMLVPCRWHGLSAIQRATVRDTFYRELVGIYGEEPLAMNHFTREYS